MDAVRPDQPVSLTRPLELLERSLAWTRPVLAAVPGHAGAEPTPCTRWDLTALLSHMVDGFMVFVEASTGWVMPFEPGDLPRDPGLLSRRLLDLGCVVLSGWAGADGPATFDGSATFDGPGTSGGRSCRVGPAHLRAGTLLEVAALEIAVHGWDVSRVCAPERRLPAGLSAALLPVALHHVTPADRPARFGPVVDVARRDPTGLLLAHLGRRPS